jgi:hypothetical protein
VVLVKDFGEYMKITYHAESADEFFGGLDTSGDDHLDEVGCDADDNDHGESLQNADQEEHLAQRHGSVAGDRHFEVSEGVLSVKMEEGLRWIVMSLEKKRLNLPAERRTAVTDN